MTTRTGSPNDGTTPIRKPSRVGVRLPDARVTYMEATTVRARLVDAPVGRHWALSGGHRHLGDNLSFGIEVV